MITHERLVEEVAARAHLSGTEESARVARVTLAALTHRLTTPQRRHLREALPVQERDAAYAVVPPADGGITELSQEIARNLETSPERALAMAQGVYSYLAEAEPALGRELQDTLPVEFSGLFSMPQAFTERGDATGDQRGQTR